jgi:hypothetical protein
MILFGSIAGFASAQMRSPHAPLFESVLLARMGFVPPPRIAMPLNGLFLQILPIALPAAASVKKMPEG